MPTPSRTSLGNLRLLRKTGKYPPPIYSVAGTEVSIFRISLTAALYYITLLVINENKILSRLLDIYRDPNKEDQNQT